MLQANDPMSGWYDRMLEKGDNLEIIRGIPRIIGVDIQALKDHCVSLGYGTRATMDILFPELTQSGESDE